MHKTLFLLVSAFSLHASVPEPIGIEVAQECRLDTTAPFRQAHPIELFRVTLGKGSLRGGGENVGEILIWADGKEYPVYSKQTRSVPVAGGKRSDQLFGQELREIMNAGDTKLHVKYKEHVKEEQSSEGKSPYYATVRTTVAMEEFLPARLEKPKIDAAFSECRKAIEGEKKKQSFVEIAVGSGAAAGIIVLGWILRRMRKKRG